MRDRLYLSNGNVAWEIPYGGSASIAGMYRVKAYLPPPGWEVLESLDSKWRPGNFGEMRRVSAKTRSRRSVH